MTAKHTPGEWAVDDDGDVCTDDLERLVATVDWRHVSLRDGEAAANARLIAAAPDLLAACEHVRDTIREFLPTVMSEDLTAIEAAIAKAKGEP